MIRIKVEEWRVTGTEQRDCLVNPALVAAVTFLPEQRYEDGSQMSPPSAVVLLASCGQEQATLRVTDPPSIDRLLELERS